MQARQGPLRRRGGGLGPQAGGLGRAEGGGGRGRGLEGDVAGGEPCQDGAEAQLGCHVSLSCGSRRTRMTQGGSSIMLPPTVREGIPKSNDH